MILGSLFQPKMFCERYPVQPGGGRAVEQRAGAQAQGIEMCTAMCCMEQAASWEQPSPKPTEGVLLLPCLTALPSQ